VAHFPPSQGRLLLVEFELLKTRPREAFDRICAFLGISAFPHDFEIRKYATEDRDRYGNLGPRATLCTKELNPALEALRERLARSNEHARLAQLIAEAGSPWVSRRILLNQSHCK
ncbi:unnamed protein product, partial [Polarella glacialis]